MNLLYESMQMPKNCEVNNTIFKKLFYENASMSSSDKEIFQDHIQKILWKYSFKEDTINIQPYRDNDREYDEISLIEVLLEDDSKYKRIAEIIQRTIPYPLILVLVYKDNLLICVAHKRINKNDESKNTVDEFIFTEWIDLNSLENRDEMFFESLNLKNLSYANFYKFYSSIVDKVNIYNASQYQKDVGLLMSKDALELKRLTDEIETLDIKIADLRGKIKKEKHFNLKVDYNIQLKKLIDCRNDLIDKLNR